MYSGSAPKRPYRGRFAPSPSGPLHFGSLLAALTSYLQARSQQGQWLLRIEDLDPPREQAGAADSILRTLDAFGLHWDETVVYQSQRHRRYDEVLAQLSAQALLYRCQCSRLRLQSLEGYDRHCLKQPPSQAQRCAWRLQHLTPFDQFQDEFLGQICVPRSEQDDFIVKRKDGYYAYQLAVVIDDADSHISQVVRGSDLLLATGRQLYLYQCLSLPAPSFAHLPVATLAGRKLSKQNQAPALDLKHIPQLLQQALAFLGQAIPDQDFPSIMLQQASLNWQPALIPKQLSLSL